VGAVKCAINNQPDLAERNAQLPDECKMECRIVITSTYLGFYGHSVLEDS
jgi:hypothetical protein